MFTEQRRITNHLGVLHDLILNHNLFLARHHDEYNIMYNKALI